MIVLLAVGGFAVAVATVRAFGAVLASPTLERENHRGARLPTAAGICLVVALLVVEGIRSTVDPATTTARVLVLAATVAFGLLGALDDLLGDGGDRGIRGHVRAALGGRLTTGMVKLAGGALVGVALAAAAHDGSVARTLADGALVALAANLGNLFDRAPGRTIKWALVAYVPLAIVAGTSEAGLAAAVVIGAAVGLLPGDVRERFMLGDTGANALGAALGITAVLALGPAARIITMVVLLALNLVSEIVSFSRVIAAVPPLRALDRLGRLAVVALLVVAVVLSSAPAASAQRHDERLLVVSLPGLTWADVEALDLPVLESFLQDASIADLAPRSVRHSSRPGDAYLTIGGGTRAVGDPDVDGDVLPPDADFAGEDAAGVYERRTGRAAADAAALVLPWPSLVRANDREPYDIVLGLLAETLHDEGVRTAVIGNADGSDVAAVSRERQAGLALADDAGRLSAGAVGTELLVADPDVPFGVRLDHERVVDEFERVWEDESRSTVLVEASDLARVLRYRTAVDAERYRSLRAQAASDADALLGELLASVDPERDSVMVVSPYYTSSRSPLTVVALRTPDRPVGYLQSASSQRAGIVTLVDVAPTILDVFGISRPVEMEGRPFEIERSSASLAHRIDHLVTINDASKFRENLLTPTTIAAVLVLAAVVALMIVAVVDGRSRRWHRAIAFAALADLSILPMSYVARAFPLEELGVVFYWSFLVVSALLLAVAAEAAARRVGTPLVAIAVVLGFSVLVLVGDVMTGSNLHLSAAFGYSPTGNSRLYGISNYSFGLLSAGALVVAALIGHRWPTKKGQAAAIGLLGFTLVVLGVPTWGSDVGGIIAFTPTVLVFAALLLGRRPRVRSLVAMALASVAAVVVFGLIDLARPASERAHLGRLFERVGDEGLEPLLSIMERKLLANLEVSVSSFWVAAIPITIATWLFLRSWSTHPLAAVHARVPTLHAALVAGAVAAVLGSAVNDSGAIVGGVACLTLTTTLVFLTMRTE